MPISSIFTGGRFLTVLLLLHQRCFTTARVLNAGTRISTRSGAAFVLSPAGRQQQRCRRPASTHHLWTATSGSKLSDPSHTRLAATATPLLLPVPAFNNPSETWKTPQGLAWTQLLLDSFEKAVGEPLIPHRDEAAPEEQAQALYYAPFVVVSHQTQEDPILSYGNKRALDRWEMDLPTLTSTPSRLTAEPVAREERQRLLDEVKAKGFISNYQGVRISSTGKRFNILQAVVWEVYDADGVRRGQAAMFDAWEDL